MRNILVNFTGNRGTAQRISTHKDNMALEVYYLDSQKKIRRAVVTLLQAGDLLQAHVKGEGEFEIATAKGNIAQKLGYK